MAHRSRRARAARFEDYCQQRWGWGRDYAYKLIGSAQTTKRLSVDHGIHEPPKTERQARAERWLARRLARLVASFRSDLADRIPNRELSP